MDQLKLTDDEWRCYAEHFGSCDLEGNGRLPLARATELFSTSQLTAEQLNHVLMVSGAKRVGHFGRSQFYIALRCIALVQAGVPVERITTDSLRWQQFDKDAHLPKLGKSISPKSEKPPETPTRSSAVFAVPAYGQPPVPPPKFAIRRMQTITGNEHAQPQPPTAARSHPPSLQTQHSLATSMPSAYVSVQPTAPAPPPSATIHSNLATSAHSGGAISANKTGWASFEDADEPKARNSIPVDDSHSQRSFAPAQVNVLANPPTVSNSNKISPQVELDEKQDENDALVQNDESALLLDAAGVAQLRPEDATGRKFDDDWCHFSENEQTGRKVSNQTHPDEALLKMKTSSLDKERMYDPAAFQKRKPEKATGAFKSGVEVADGKTDSESETDSDSDTSTQTDGDANADEVDSEDVYRMTSEQREYYVDHFLTLLAEPDPKAILDGSAARAFLLKSNLPVDDLKRIWQLSDTDQDGALTMEEFCTAMHLVVLRRNGLEIPDRLELSKMPYAQLDTQADQPDDRQPDDAYSAGHLEFDEEPTFVPNWPALQTEIVNNQASHISRLSPPAESSVVAPALPTSFSAQRVKSPSGAKQSQLSAVAFKPPPLPPRKAPQPQTSSPSLSNRVLKESGKKQASVAANVPEETNATASPEMSNEWLHEQIKKLQEAKMVLERLNRELNAELQETTEQRIALEIQLEHIRRPSLI